MTTAETGWAATGWAAAVRERLGPGRLLPLGEPADGAWLAERAALTVLLRAAGAVRGVVPGPLRVGLAEPVGTATFPVPPGGLPPGPLRIAAEFTAEASAVEVATTGAPLPALAEEVRRALFASAERELGLAVVAVDLRVTGLTESADAVRDSTPPAPPPGRPSPPPEDPAALTTLTVEGVAALTDALGPAVHRTEGRLYVELATTAGHRVLDVTRRVRTALSAAAPEATVITVLVSEIR